MICLAIVKQKFENWSLHKLEKYSPSRSPYIRFCRENIHTHMSYYSTEKWQYVFVVPSFLFPATANKKPHTHHSHSHTQDTDNTIIFLCCIIITNYHFIHVKGEDTIFCHLFFGRFTTLIALCKRTANCCFSELAI